MTIVILSNTANIAYYNLLKNCIDSIDTDRYSVIVVETNSKLKEKEIPLRAKFIFPEKEFNYNEFLNIGISATDDDKLILANNDIVFEDNCLQEIEDKLDIFDSVSPVDLNTHINIEEDTIGTKVGYHVLGCCIALTRITLNAIGKFDEKFKFWYQDNDYCNNLKKHGLSHALLSNAKIRHRKAQSHSLIHDKLYEMTHGLESTLKNKWEEYE